MNTFQQSTGRFTDADGNQIGIGYSGNGEGLNNPQMQSVARRGPLPQGDYEIGAMINDAKLGNLAMPLTPLTMQNMFGRSGFFIHGDNMAMNYSASEGCIILP